MKYIFLLQLLLASVLGFSLVDGGNRTQVHSSRNGYYCLRILAVKMVNNQLQTFPWALCEIDEDGKLVPIKEFKPVGVPFPLQTYYVSENGKFCIVLNGMLPGSGVDEEGTKDDYAIAIYFVDQPERILRPALFEMTPKNEHALENNREWWAGPATTFLDNDGILHLQTVNGVKWTYEVARNIAQKSK